MTKVQVRASRGRSGQSAKAKAKSKAKSDAETASLEIDTLALDAGDAREARGGDDVAPSTALANAAALDDALDPRSVRSDARDAAFFAAIEGGRTVDEACGAARYARTCVYRWRDLDTAFAEGWARARAIAADLLEEEADRRGRHGVTDPIFFQGGQVGERRKYSDALLLARLKALRPELYRERYQVQGLAGQTVTVVIRDLRAEQEAARVIEAQVSAVVDGAVADSAAAAPAQITQSTNASSRS